MKNFGLIIEPRAPEDYVFGGEASLGGDVIVPSANWESWLPDFEYQSTRELESYACVTFATLNIVEILERQEYGETNNWSDRYLATASGTKEKKGNDPTFVAEILRKNGDVKEKDLPFDSSIDSYDKFFAPIPEGLINLARDFVRKYTFGHEYIPSTASEIMNALKYSPVGFSVAAWTKDANGLYYRPQGLSDNHFTVCCGYKENEYWLIYDTYSDNGTPLKKVRWDCLPMIAKRYTLHRKTTARAFLKNLYFGQIDPEVEYLQRALISLKYDIPHAVTTRYGTETRNAVEAFQNDHGILGNWGMNVGPKTRNALNIALNPQEPFGGSLFTYIFSYFSSV